VELGRLWSKFSNVLDMIEVDWKRSEPLVTFPSI
jgi:hypothetical protein